MQYTHSLLSVPESSPNFSTTDIVTNYCVHVNTLNPHDCYKEITQQHHPISLLSFQPDSYFAASQGYGVTKIATTPSPEQQDKKNLKNSIQSTSGEELKERVFQFLKARPAVASEFLAFSLQVTTNKANPTKIKKLTSFFLFVFLYSCLG
jgi:hypothetical protein